MTGRSTSRLGRFGRVAMTALLAMLVVFAPAMTGIGKASADTTALPISISFACQSCGIHPLAPQPGDTVTVAGMLTNTTADPITDLDIELEHSSPLIARNTFDEFADDPTGNLDGLVPVTGLLPLHDQTIEAGRSEDFTIKVSVASLVDDEDSWQVRELGLAVTGSTPFTAGTLGQLRTFLPYAPRDAAAGRDRVDLAWLWPLVDRPHRGVGATWFDDELAPELQAGGRLSTLLDAAEGAETQTSSGPRARPEPVPVTFALDPMLLDDINVMRTGYRVASGKGTVVGTGSANANTFLTNLRAAADQGNVLALPYGDPDIAAEVRAGLTTLLGQAIQSGNKLVAKLLPGATTVNADWPPGGMLDERSVDALLSGYGLTSLVLTDLALPPADGEMSETPTAHASLSTDAGTIDTALTDSTLSGAVNAGANPGADPTLSAQRVLAETLMIEAEAPSDQRDVVIAPARRWAPSLSYAETLLDDTAKVPWLTPVTLSQVLQSPESTVERAPLSYPGTARRAELSPSYMSEIASLQQKVADLSSILPASDQSTLPYGGALLRAVSSAWRSDSADQQAQYSAVKASVSSAMNSVKIASNPGSRITLTSHDGQFPVTIANNLDVPVNVTVDLQPNLRLTFAHQGREQRTIPAHQLLAVDFRATAKTSGTFPVYVQLQTPDGHNYGGPVILYVRSTVYGTITLVITAAATAALLIAVGVRLTRRAMTARRTAATAQ